jgi:hypothetical protein
MKTAAALTAPSGRRTKKVPWRHGLAALSFGLVVSTGAQAQSASVPENNLPLLLGWGLAGLVTAVGPQLGGLPATGLRLTLNDARHFAFDPPGRSPATRLGVEWSPATSRFGLEKGSRAFSLQLDANTRMSLRVRRSGVVVAVRAQF